MDIQYEYNICRDWFVRCAHKAYKKAPEKTYSVPLADTFFQNDCSFRIKQPIQLYVAVIAVHDENGHCLPTRGRCSLFNDKQRYGGGKLFPDNL